jgi:hypothetical protein
VQIDQASEPALAGAFGAGRPDERPVRCPAGSANAAGGESDGSRDATDEPAGAAGRR